MDEEEFRIQETGVRMKKQERNTLEYIEYKVVISWLLTSDFWILDIWFIVLGSY